MNRGRKLEPLVLREVQIKTKMHFKRCGLLLSADHPVFGASPDGISSTHVLEIKCPLTAKTKVNYINAKGDLADKVNLKSNYKLPLVVDKWAFYVLLIQILRKTKMSKLSPYPMMKNM